MAFGFTRLRDGNIFGAEREEIRERRRNRFRILVCIDGTDASYDGIRFAAKIGYRSECDIILLYVRPIDQGLRSGGLQVRVARENMLDWGLELPGIRNLKKSAFLSSSSRPRVSYKKCRSPNFFIEYH